MATCYGQDGRAHAKYYPCNQTAVINHEHTSCCKKGENCFTNGLCRSTAEGSATNYYWLEGCTDPTFSDPACSIRDPCRDFDNLYWKCFDTNAWCCNNGGASPLKQRSGHVNTTCCDKPEFMFNAPDPVVYAKADVVRLPISTLLSSSETASVSRSNIMSTTSPTSADSNGSLPTAITTSAGISSGQNTTKHHSSSSNTTSVGIGVGVGLGVGVIALSVALYFLVVRNQKRRAERAEYASTELPVVNPRIELQGHEAAVEALSEKVIYEMRA